MKVFHLCLGKMLADEILFFMDGLLLQYDL